MSYHELRSALAPVLSATRVLQTSAPEGPRDGRRSALIGRQARHIAGLLHDLTDLGGRPCLAWFPALSSPG